MNATDSPACVILSGGASRRMGRPKALLDAGEGRSFLERIVDAYREAGVRRIVLVLNGGLLGGRAEDIAHARGLLVVPIHAPPQGKWRSLRAGMSALPDAPYCYLQPVDQPAVDAPLLRRLLAAVPADGHAVPVHAGRGGHPILLAPPIVRQLAALHREVHLRELLRAHPRIEVAVTDPDLLRDINTPEEYAAFRATATAP